MEETDGYFQALFKMKDYTYKEKQLQLIKHLLHYPPSKICSDFVSYIFDYDTYYLKLECVSEMASSPNKSDQAIITVITKKNKKFRSTELTELVCQNKKIERAYILRTVIYFTLSGEFSMAEKIINRSKVQVKKLLFGKIDNVEELTSKTTAFYERSNCHPLSDEAKQINPEYINLIDVGLVLKIEGKYLKAHLQNGFGFSNWNNNYFFDEVQFEDDKKIYQVIEV